MGVLRFFSRQRFFAAVAIYAVVIATWAVKWHLGGWGGAPIQAENTPLYVMLARRAPQWFLACLSLLFYVLTAAIMQSIFSRVHPGQSKNYLMHLLVPLLSTMAITDDAWGSPAAALGTLATLYVLTLLLTKEERPHADTLFRTCFTSGIATLLYYPAVALLLVVLVALVYNNDLTIKKILIALVGFLVPFAFAVGAALLQGYHANSYIGAVELMRALGGYGQFKEDGPYVRLLLWGSLLAILFLLTISRKSSRSKTILTAYHDTLLRSIGFLSVVVFALLPNSSAVPVMIAPAVGSSYVFYFTSKGKTRLKGWAFAAVVLLIIVGNVWGAKR